MILNKNLPVGSSVGFYLSKNRRKIEARNKRQRKVEDEWDVRICTYTLPTPIKAN